MGMVLFLLLQNYLRLITSVTFAAKSQQQLKMIL